MSGFLLKLQPVLGVVSRDNVTGNAVQSIPEIGSLLVGRRLKVLGGLFALFLLIVLIVTTISIQQARHSAAYLEIVGRMQMHSQRLAKASQQAVLGDISSFVQLQDSRDQIKNYVKTLTQGGEYRGNNIPPIIHGPAVILEEYVKKWHIEEKNISLILDSKSSLISLGGAVEEINFTNKKMLELIGHLIDRMNQLDGVSNEIAAIEALKTLTQSFVKNANALLLSEILISEIVVQLENDREGVGTIMAAFIHGNTGLQLSPLKDKNTKQMLAQAQILFNTIDTLTGVVQKHAPNVAATRIVIHKILQNNEGVLGVTEKLDNALQGQGSFTPSPLNIIAYITGAFAIITLFLFIKVYIEDTRDRALASENENRRNQKAILRLLDDMGSFADGDLTVRAVVTEDITGAMADSINYTIEELHILVEGINKASTQVTEASGQAQNISSELLVAAQKQSENIEETTIAVLGIAESIGKVSKSAAESAKVAKQSLAAAEKGAVAVRESSVGMNEIRTHIQETAKRIKRLGENSQEIGEIVGLISDLTEMTNVLALNAAIQAAAAGDAGRGFTVVAQEVQRLAERSAEATKQISTLVKTTQGDTQEAIAAMEKSIFEVVEGGKLSDATGQALEEIEQVSNDLAQLIAGISNATHVQAQAADQVVKNMEEILQITRQTTNGTIQTTTSVKQISGFAAELKASVSNFKI
ncbi:MAG: methyl-accepting chemotaxis protein [Nitrosomonadales bacterium]|nr:MAG: methyl-accepting chemotaxis protein [Nitrosomonadales bacterium]